MTGIPVEHLLAKAGAAPGANAVTFVSADGTQQTFPLGYVVGRHAVLSYEINDEDLSASVGGSNQLWMTKTPANYFVRVHRGRRARDSGCGRRASQQPQRGRARGNAGLGGAR